MALRKEDIFAVADRLAAEGKNPTQTSVRQALGGGSFASIGPALKEWKEAQQKEQALAEVHVPESISDRMEQLKAAAWQAAMEEAERRLSSERQALHEAQEEADAAVTEANEAVAILEREAEERNTLIEQQQKEVMGLEQRVAEVQEEKSRAEQAHLSETARLSEKIEGLVARLDDAQAAKTEARADAEQARNDADRYKKLAESEVKRAAEAENAMRKAEQQIAVANSQKEAAQEQAKERAERIDSLEKQYRKDIEEVRSDHRSAIEALRTKHKSEV